MVPQEGVVVHVVLQVRSLTADFDAMEVVGHRLPGLVATQRPVPHLQTSTAALPARCASDEHVPSVSRRGRLRTGRGLPRCSPLTAQPDKRAWQDK
jgi:hypothetical protein